MTASIPAFVRSRSRRLYVMLAAAPLLALRLSAQMTAGSDDFDDNTLGTVGIDQFWVFQSSNNTGSFTNQNGRIEFTTTNGSGYHASSLFHTREFLSAGSYAFDWTATVSATNLMNSANLGSGFAQIGLTSTTRFDSNSDGTSDSANGLYGLLLSVAGNGLTVTTNSGRWNSTNGSFDFVTLATAIADPSDVQLRLAWDASAQDLLAQYSVDSGATFITDRVFNLDGADFGVGTPYNNAFSLYLFGQTSEIGSSPVVSGQMYLDNFSVTAIPEPSTYAALAGLGALGLVLWRRRQAKFAT